MIFGKRKDINIGNNIDKAKEVAISFNNAISDLDRIEKEDDFKELLRIIAEKMVLIIQILEDRV